MIRIEESIQVNRPRARVFEFLTDIEKMPAWQSGVIESKAVSEGPMRPGFEFGETAKVGFWQLKNVCKVTDIKTNERFSFEAKSSGPLDYDGRFELQPVAGGTRLSLSGSARLKGPWRLMQPLLAGDLRKESRAELATIKRMLEAEATVPERVAADQA